MQAFIGILLAAAFVVLFIIGRNWRNRILQEELANFQEKSHSYTLVMDNTEQGVEVTGLILNPEVKEEGLEDADLTPAAFTVEVTQSSNSGNENTSNREVETAALCNIDGNTDCNDEAKDHILLTFKKDAGDNAFSPFFTDENGTIKWKEVYTCCVKHPKFTGDITTANDPLITKEAKAVINVMDAAE